MKLVTVHNHFDAEHLAAVVEEMRVLGAPTIKCFDLGFDGLVQAVEGTHRIRACEILEIAPILVFLDPETTIEEAGIDFDNGNPECKISEIGDWENYSIEIEQ